MTTVPVNPKEANGKGVEIEEADESRLLAKVNAILLWLNQEQNRE